jgi:hypothetical protein
VDSASSALKRRGKYDSLGAHIISARIAPEWRDPVATGTRPECPVWEKEDPPDHRPKWPLLTQTGYLFGWSCRLTWVNALGGGRTSVVFRVCL